MNALLKLTEPIQRNVDLIISLPDLVQPRFDRANVSWVAASSYTPSDSSRAAEGRPDLRQWSL